MVLLICIGLPILYSVTGLVSCKVAYRISPEYREFRDLYGPFIDLFCMISWPYFWICYFQENI